MTEAIAPREPQRSDDDNVTRRQSPRIGDSWKTQPEQEAMPVHCLSGTSRKSATGRRSHAIITMFKPRGESQTSMTRGQRTTTRRRALHATAALTTMGLAGCFRGMGGGDEGTFTVGANLPLSQGWEPYGNTQRRAAEIAIQDINDAGGLDGRDVELIVKDNQVDPQTVRDKTTELVTQDGADIILGPISSASRVAMASELDRHEIPALYTTQYEGRAAEDYCNEWLFKTAEIPVQQIEPFIPWLIDNHGDQFYLLGSDYIWPKTMNELITAEVERHGGEVLDEEYVQLNATDFSSIIPRIEQANPDILFMELTGASVPAIQQQMHEQDVRGQWTEVGLAHGQGTIAGAPPEAVEGLLGCHAYKENNDNAANREFVAKFKDAYGEDALITYLTGPAFTGLKLLEEAVNRAGGTSTDDLISGLDGASVDSVMGETTIERDHQITVGTTVSAVNANRKFEPITSFDPVPPVEHCDNI